MNVAVGVPRLTGVPETSSLRFRPDVLLVGVVLLWLTYNVCGLRIPWSPIVVSDSDSGAAMRQMIFTLAALVACRRLFVTRSIGPVLVQHLGLVGLGAWLVLGAGLSADPVLTVKRGLIFNFGLVTLLTVVHASSRPVQLMQRIVTAVTMVAAWVSVVGFFVFPKAAVSIPHRPGLAGVAGHPNTLAPAMVVGFLVSLGVRCPPGRGRLALRFGQAGLLIALVLTNSITSIVLLLGGVLIYAALVLRPYRRGVVQLAVVSTVLLVSLVGLQTMKAVFFDVVDRDPSLSGRDELWSAVLHEGLKEPLFGQGFGAFWYEGRGREIVGTWNPRQAHHAYLDVFVDVGAVGLVLVLLVLAGSFWTAWMRIRPAPGSACRSAVASMVAVAASLFSLYAFGESFLLKLDKLPMFCMLWFVCLLGNRDENRIERELSEAPAPAAEVIPPDRST
jgi:O-antigen ligase